MRIGVGLAITRGRQATTTSYPARWGLIEYWSLSEASGDRAGVNGNTLTDNNTVTGGVALAANLGASSQFVAANTESLSVADTAPLSAGNVDWGLALWALVDSSGTDRVLAFKGTGSAATTLEFALRYQNSSGLFRFEWGDSGGTGIVGFNATVFGAISTATPYHLFAYHDSVNDVVGLVVNGVATTTASLGRFPTDTAGAFRVGVLNATTFPHDGRISDVALFKSPPGGIAALLTEIPTHLYNSGNGRPYPWT